jgi:hypothetical protein
MHRQQILPADLHVAAFRVEHGPAPGRMVEGV